MSKLKEYMLYGALVAVVAVSSVSAARANAAVEQSHTSSKFTGAKANTGTVTHSVQGGKNVLTLSKDFVTPDTPDPHWQVVDSTGTVYMLQKISIKDGKMNTSITLPAYVRDVAKVQIWCAWAEVNLGEATFATPLKLN